MSDAVGHTEILLTDTAVENWLWRIGCPPAVIAVGPEIMDAHFPGWNRGGRLGQGVGEAKQKEQQAE
jgi:hypothetical protein